MKLTIDMENLEELVQAAAEENTRAVVKDAVETTAKKYISENLRSVIEGICQDTMEKHICEYITSAKINIDGGWYDDTAETYTVEQYIKKCLGDVLENKTLKRVYKDSSGYKRSENVTFEEFIRNEFDADKLIGDKLHTFMENVKKDINQNIETMFTDTAKSMLSDTVFNVLMKNETFQKMNDNIKCLADKNE